MYVWIIGRNWSPIAPTSVASGKGRDEMKPFTILAAISILLALFWTGIGRRFTANRLVLVPMFLTVALLMCLVLVLVRGGSDPSEVGR